MMITKIFEHKKIPERAEGVEGVSPDFYKILEEKAKTSKFLSFSNSGRVKALQYVGVVACKDEVLEIYPKVSKKDDLEKSKEVLIKMLSRVYDFKIDILDKASLKKSDTLLEVIVKIFIKLVEDVIKKGIIRDYVLVNENERFLKGRLNISKHIQKNFIHKERFFIEYDEYLIDCLENQIIKTALLKILRLTNIHLKKIRKLLFIFDEVSVINKELIKKLQFNRLNSHYKKALELAILILDNIGTEIFSGSKDLFAFMFDMNDLFEKYVALFYKEKKEKDDNRVKFQVSKKFLDRQVRVDIISEDEVVDTKYKIIKSYDDISSSDLYQLLAYALKFDKTNVILIYPYYECKKIESKKEVICNREIEFKFSFFDLVKDEFL